MVKIIYYIKGYDLGYGSTIYHPLDLHTSKMISMTLNDAKLIISLLDHNFMAGASSYAHLQTLGIS